MLKDSLLLKNIKKHIEPNMAEIASLNATLKARTFQKKEILLGPGQICNQLFFVEKGSIRAFNSSDDGKEATIMFAISDWWITDIYCFTKNMPAMLSFEALEETSVFILAKDDFKMLLEEHPLFNQFFRILFQNAYAREQLRVLDTIRLSTEERYYGFLEKYPQIVEKVTQKQIASYLGVTPEFLSSVKRKP